MVDSFVLVIMLVLLGLFGLLSHEYVKDPPVPALLVRQPRGRRGSVVAALMGVAVVAVWYALEVVPAWQYRIRPPDSPSEWADFREGNVAEVMFRFLLRLCLLGCGVVTAIATLVLAIVAYVHKAWRPATIAMSILAATVVAYLIGFRITG